MLRFPKASERQTKFLSTFLIDFFNTEYKRKQSMREPDEVDQPSDDEEDKEETAEEPKSRRQTNRRYSTRRSAINTLKILLELFSKFSHAKAGNVARADELHSIYMELLISGDLDLQRNALACLFTFKEEFLVPYR
jgi:hypothetical protein